MPYPPKKKKGLLPTDKKAVIAVILDNLARIPLPLREAVVRLQRVVAATSFSAFKSTSADVTASSFASKLLPMLCCRFRAATGSARTDVASAGVSVRMVAGG
jgi:hypothetical protein